MFVYLSKKISVPNGVPLETLSWNNSDGFIAIGGDDGILKVLKLEEPKNTKENRIKGLSAPSNLDMNDSLEGHSTTVRLVVWNERFQKLTSADHSGRIIVWVMYDGRWYEEMINSRSRVTVTSMQWSPDGEKICIAYDDGNVIVGSVDGQRLWGSELSQQSISQVQWNPESTRILFALGPGSIQVYDCDGNFLFKVRSLVNEKIFSFAWYWNVLHFQATSQKRLAIGFTSGRVQLMDNEKDAAAELIETNLTLAAMSFSPNGLYIAFSGTRRSAGKDTPLIDFYSASGQHLRTLKVPGLVKSLSWENLRVAMAIDSYIYFANVRPDYLWGYCCDSSTLVYAFQNDDGKPRIMFWNTKTGGRHIKTVNHLSQLAASGDHVVTSYSSVESQLVLLNSIGAEIDEIRVPFPVKFLSQSRHFAVAASLDKIFVWRLRITEKNEMTQLLMTTVAKSSKTIEIDPDGSNEITAICTSPNYFVIARAKGDILRYALPSMELENQYTFYGNKPINIQLSSNSSRLSVIDSNALLYIIDLDRIDEDGGGKGEQINLEKRDCWNVRWANDDPTQFALNEKTKLTIFHDRVHEEPTVTSAFVSLMKDHEVECVLLDDIMKRPEDPQPGDIFIQESEMLRKVRTTIEKLGIDAAKEMILRTPSPKLWRILGEAAMEVLKLDAAEEAFIHCKDYFTIQIIKKVKNYKDDEIKRAEIAAYFGRHDEAEELHRSIDRIDLATEHRRILGQDEKVLQLIKATHDSALADDNQLRNALKNVGIKAADEKRWHDASDYLGQAGEFTQNIRANFMAGNWVGMQNIVEALLDGSEQLIDCAHLYRSLGQAELAVDCYLRGGKPEVACECAIELNDWQTACDLAEKYNIKNVAQTLEQKASKLLQANLELQACQLYRKAGNFLKAAHLLFSVAATEGTKISPLPLRVKKLYVLAALLVEQHHEQRKAQTGRLDTLGVLEGVLREEKKDIESSSMVDSAWRGAEAWHFYILACKQLYSGYPDAAATTTISLCQFEDLLDPVKIYSLQATAAAAARRFGLCSRAFTRLESLPMLTEEQREQYTQLAIKIFQKYKPQDANQYDRMHKDTKVPTCIVSGRPLTDCQFWMCSVCRHCAYEQEVNQLVICPLCHSQILG